jgi:hypothetical protein
LKLRFTKLVIGYLVKSLFELEQKRQVVQQNPELLEYTEIAYQGQNRLFKRIPRPLQTRLAVGKFLHY